jgi:SP family arabinose:H+ symporter-like MFS transporter
MTSETRHTLIVASIVSLGGFVFGFDASVISGVVGYVRQAFLLNDLQVGFVVSAPTLGAVLSALVSGPVSDKIGRKRTLLIIAALYTISAIASALANSFLTLSVARFIGGLAFSSLIVAPVYIAEISPARLRGRLVSFNQLNIVFGLSAAYFANALVQNLSQQDYSWVSSLAIDSYPWRWMLGLEAFPAFIYCILLIFLPETPRWLVMKGRYREARTVLQRLHNAEKVEGELADIEDSLPKQEESLLTRINNLLDPRIRFALVIGIIIGVAQQITGVNAIYFYAPTIFEQSGVGTNAAFSQAIWVGIFNVVFTLVSMACIDRFGRKPLLLFGLGGVLVSMLVTSYCFSQARYELTPESILKIEEQIPPEALNPMVGIVFESDLAFKDALAEVLGDDLLSKHESLLIQAAIDINARLVLFGILGFVASFAVSLGPVMWVLFSEIFPNRMRGTAISLVGFLNAGTSYVVQLIFPWEINTLGTTYTFLIYAGFAVFFLIVIAKILPETKGKTLEALEGTLDKSRRS